MKQHELDLIEQALLNTHNQTVEACIDLVEQEMHRRDYNCEFLTEVLETLLFDNLNELRAEAKKAI